MLFDKALARWLSEAEANEMGEEAHALHVHP
jgi:hypothetical protein